MNNCREGEASWFVSSPLWGKGRTESEAYILISYLLLYHPIPNLIQARWDWSPKVSWLNHTRPSWGLRQTYRSSHTLSHPKSTPRVVPCRLCSLDKWGVRSDLDGILLLFELPTPLLLLDPTWGRKVSGSTLYRSKRGVNRSERWRGRKERQTKQGWVVTNHSH